MNTDDTIERAADMGHHAVDAIADATDDAISPATAHAAVDDAQQAAQTALTALREQAAQLADRVAGYARDEPIKALLMAAAAGMVLSGVMRTLGRMRD